MKRILIQVSVTFAQILKAYPDQELPWRMYP